MNSVWKATVLLGCSAAMTLVYAGGQVGVNHEGDGSVQAAIRFEQGKAAADARQAQIQSAREQQPVATPSVSTAGRTVGVNHQGDGSVQAAIRFEQGKAAADARQAQIQSEREQQPVATPSVSTAGRTVGVNHQGDGGVQAAIRFEQAKAAADARQAQIHSEQASNHVSVGSADRSMTGHK